MSLDNHKITTYEDNVVSLPDYPSDAGYTAAQLKAIFDGRGDKEIKNKHNALIDELSEKFSEVDESVENSMAEHQESETAHQGLFDEKVSVEDFESFKDTNDEAMRGKADKTLVEQYRETIEIALSEKADVSDTYSAVEIDNCLSEKVDKVAGKGLSSNDFTDEWKQDISNAFNEAIYAQMDIGIHLEDSENPHQVTAEQIGALTADSLNDEMGKYIPQLWNAIGVLEDDKADKADVYTKEETVGVAYNTFVASMEYQDLLGDVRVLQEDAGNIDAALDSILAIQNELIGG